MTAPLVEPGAEVPPLERTIDLRAMIAYAGSTWDWHRLHYDPDYLASRGLPAPVVDGQVFGALLAEQLQDWLGPGAFVRRLHFRFKNLVFAGETVRCVGRVSAVEDGVVHVEQRVLVVGGDQAERVAVEPAGAEIVLRGEAT
ncbi:MaoC/PaaZ C-terminal domain-containing protein [Nonomuraea sp. MCN248]|uniref:MaoC/PaaZ C-terminal domain-containing protein n=1 Tax=Nonomuraea corallina TaxID=2989783 RepID=A0ABT4SGK4_9ACTN|nr:MaoC/PaaZ C-terminal domain-containing protein [Nonomuraea corallina]MDA0636322.1 MaoC/PaaZ C-terminal domain-containing protein [Nonomuraea corallina]